MNPRLAGGQGGQGGNSTGGASTGGSLASGGSSSADASIGGGGSPGTGGAVNSGGSANSGGAVNSGGSANGGGSGNNGGAPGAGGSAGAGGGPSTGGSENTGGIDNIDASLGGGGRDAGGSGTTDSGQGGAILLNDASVLNAPPVVDCLPDPVIPDGGDVTCPRDLRRLANWFPDTPPMGVDPNNPVAFDLCHPAPHPADECKFYVTSWHEFLLALQPDPNTGQPALLRWNTIENTFGAGRGQPTPNPPQILGGVTQAGGRQVLIDQNGHAIYYAIHMNPAFVDFVNKIGLVDANHILAAPPDLAFPSTIPIVETKEAWMDITGLPAANFATFFTTPAMVPTLTGIDPNTNQVTVDDTHLRQVTLALLAIHVVHTIPGHPEFIWSSFQHINPTTGLPDVAPSAPDLPANTPATTVIDPNNFLLYRGGTTAGNADNGSLRPVLDVANQRFTSTPTSIFRAYPGSKSTDPAIDDDVAATNDSLTTRFGQNPRPRANDKRPNYRLVGAIWQDQPGKTFGVDKVLANDQSLPDIILNGPDSPLSITGGEDTLSSTAMESFTQYIGSFHNCFTCHDTQATSANGTPAVRSKLPVLMKPGLINVSHIFNEVVRLNLN